MSARTYRSSSPDQWTLPRPTTDASSRYLKHGPIQPMAEEHRGIFKRLFRVH